MRTPEIRRTVWFTRILKQADHFRKLNKKNPLQRSLQRAIQQQILQMPD
tara:strand:- start:298 stop:444 length:147 start_codon:yes stop_codon:yes gene_type:complete